MPNASASKRVCSLVITIGMIVQSAIAAHTSSALGFMVEAKNNVPGDIASNTPILEEARLLITATDKANNKVQAKPIIKRAERTDKSCAPNTVPTPEMKYETIGYLPMFVQAGISVTWVSSKREPQPG